MNSLVVGVVIFTVLGVAGVIAWNIFAAHKRKAKDLERGMKMVPMLIHLPPPTDDIQVGGRDERDVTNEALSTAQIMYSIIASTVSKGWKAKLFGQRHISFEIIASGGFIKYYAVVPAVITESVKHAISTAYPTARLEEIEQDNIFSKTGGTTGVAGGELSLKKDFYYPIATYEDTRWDSAMALLNALSNAKDGEGVALQIMFRPADPKWVTKAVERTQKLRDGKKGGGFDGSNIAEFAGDVMRAPFEPPEVREREKKEEENKPLSTLQQDEISAIENKTRYPGFEVLIRVIASSELKARSESLVGGVVNAFSQLNSASYNGFSYSAIGNQEKLAVDYLMRMFPYKKKNNILNIVELASVFHLPDQNAIPNSQVERQKTKQVDGPAKLATTGVKLGINEFRGQKKEIWLQDKDRRRHTYVIGATGMGKSVFFGNIAYQDMLAGRGFAFLDPHGDVVEDILSKVPPERVDDVIYFDPGDLEHPMGMNMFEFNTPDQKDFIVQEGINMLYSLYDPGHTGIFGPRGEHMFRNAALLLMSDPNGATFIDIPRCFTDPEFVKDKLQYVTDKAVYDYWTKEFPESQKSNDSGEVTTWFVSKWSPFLSNTMMRNVLGQVKSGFNIREIMDQKKILLVNLSKGKMGEMNSKLLGMIFVMKFQTAAMSRVDTPEDERNDFCLFVDEFQNFSTESFESILSEARKFRLNLFIANQFLTQLTDKIREAVIGNVGTIIAGRIGITDAEMLEKAFLPTFGAEDLSNQPNHHAIAKVMMFDMPTSPFTMNLLAPMGKSSPELLDSLREYSASKNARSRAEVEAEINQRMGVVSAAAPAAPETPHSFMDAWAEKKAAMEAAVPSSGPANSSVGTSVLQAQKGVSLGNEVAPRPDAPVIFEDDLEEDLSIEESLLQGAGIAPIVNDGPVFDNVVPDEEVEISGGKKAEEMALPDQGNLQRDQVVKLR